MEHHITKIRDVFNKMLKVFFNLCPKTGRIVSIKLTQEKAFLFFPIIGILSIIWFLIRVIPKPSRAAYPCQRIAMGFGGSFLASFIGIFTSVTIFKKLRLRFCKKHLMMILFTICIAIGISVALITFRINPDYVFSWTPTDSPNTPIGTAKGINPGRVIWVYEPAASIWNGSTGYWWDDNNTNQTAVDSMLSRSIRGLTNVSTDALAWDALFKNFNQNHGRGTVGYVSGDKIAIKINLNNNNVSYTENDNQLDASPHMVLSLLRQLINKAGVLQSDITVYDAVRLMPDRVYNKCKNEFPNVTLMDRQGTNGRVKRVWQTNIIKYSNSSNTAGTAIPTVVYQAKYVINMSLMKGHNNAGVTFTAKNHYGSIDSPEHTYINASKRPFGSYNTLVDLIGHKELGGKTMLFLVDGLYGAKDVNDPPTKFLLPPFNNKWSSSLLVSQDPIAIDSVGFDFINSEFGGQAFVVNSDSYLHESAKANAPPSGTFYDPEGDGTRLGSLGTHEHWNNSTDRKYSRNLGTGNGIELVKLATTITVTSPNGGENWAVGEQRTITWNSEGIVGNVNIDISTNGGTSWTSLISNTANDGTQTITVPNITGNTCRIRVQEPDGTPTDTSNSNFTITNNANVFYVDPAGSDSTGTGSISNPWKTLAYAVSRPLTQGATVHLNAGTYNETQASVVPVGVNVEGAGVNNTIIRSTIADTLIKLQSSSITNGNQTLSNFKIDGQSRQLDHGIVVYNRQNVTLHDLSFSEIDDMAMCVYGSDYIAGIKIYNISITNCSKDNTDWSNGSLDIGHLQGAEIYNVTINENRGYGIKFYNNGYFKGLKIHDCNITVPTSDPLWGADICIELWNVYDDCEIYNMTVNTWFSIVVGDKGAGNYSMYIHDNKMVYPALHTKEAIEVGANDMIISNNYIENAGTAFGFYIGSSGKNNITINNNIIYETNYSGLEIHMDGTANLSDVKVYNNIFHKATTNKDVWFALGPRIIWNGSSAGNISGLYFKNNIFYNTSGQSLDVVAVQNYPAKVSDIQVQYNCLYSNVNNGTTMSGITFSNNLTSNPQIKTTGSRWDTYYQLNSNSPCVDAGTNVGLAYNGSAPDIGRWESLSTPPPPNPLICSWHFDEGAGTSVGDSGVSGSTGVITSASWETNGKIGASALKFDGVDDYVTIMDNNSLDITDAITLEAWVKSEVVDQDGSTRRIIDKGATYALGASDKAYFKLYIGGVAKESLKTWSSGDVNVWHHLVGTYDGSSMILYQDGVKVAETVTSGSIDTNTTALNIGRQSSGGGKFIGVIDEVKIYNRALTQEEVTASYNAGNTPPPPVDNPPTVSITAPNNNEVISGIVTISGTATDDKGLTTVKFYINNAEKQTLNAPPYIYVWNTVSEQDGNYTIKLVATDTISQSTSTQISVTVSNPIPDTKAPTVAITAPTANATISGSVTIAGTASDESGIKSVAHYINNVLK
ncbi:MAG TPA: hypothetical protein DCP53_08305, partial [Elusimicrobia bacterium]|nr:hypothetical protein [Elusimicrobiota bacterium]